MIDEFFIIRVKDYHLNHLPRPRKKTSNKTESLEELPVISIDTGIWSIV